MDLSERIALVTGGASGIGLASSHAFAKAGANVIIADRDEDAAERAAQDIRDAGGAAVAYAVDVSDVAQIRAMVSHIDQAHGCLHILFSHAGIQGPLGLDISEEEFDRCISVNLKSHFFLTSHARDLLRKAAPHASIIYTSSTAGLRASGRSPLYATTKAAILMLARTMARQLGPDGIRANALCPGPTDTGFARDFASASGLDEEGYQKLLSSSANGIPLGRVAHSSDVANVALFLASDHSAYLTGAAIPIDGGLTV